MLKAGVSLVAVLAAAAVPAMAGHECGPAMVQLVVLDQGGAALQGLAPSDFKVKIKNQGANVTAVDYGTFSHSTLLLISRTGTMGQSLKSDLGLQLGNAIVSVAPGPVMGATFGEQVSALADARQSPLGTRLGEAGGNRNPVYDAVLAGMASMNPHRGDAVVVITDSADVGSKTTLNEVQQRLQATGARLYVIALPPATAVGNMQALAELAQSSGGALVAPLTVEDPSKELQITQAQVDGAVSSFTRSFEQYSAVYQLETDVDGQDRPMPLKVEVDRHKMGAGRVIAPATLAPCTAIGQ